MFHNYLNKAAAYKTFTNDLILFLFLDCHSKIVNIFIR